MCGLGRARAARWRRRRFLAYRFRHFHWFTRRTLVRSYGRTFCALDAPACLLTFFLCLCLSLLLSSSSFPSLSTPHTHPFPPLPTSPLPLPLPPHTSATMVDNSSFMAFLSRYIYIFCVSFGERGGRDLCFLAFRWQVHYSVNSGVKKISGADWSRQAGRQERTERTDSWSHLHGRGFTPHPIHPSDRGKGEAFSSLPIYLACTPNHACLPLPGSLGQINLSSPSPKQIMYNVCIIFIILWRWTLLPQNSFFGTT